MAEERKEEIPPRPVLTRQCCVFAAGSCMSGIGNQSIQLIQPIGDTDNARYLLPNERSGVTNIFMTGGIRLELVCERKRLCVSRAMASEKLEKYPKWCNEEIVYFPEFGMFTNALTFYQCYKSENLEIRIIADGAWTLYWTNLWTVFEKHRCTRWVHNNHTTLASYDGVLYHHLPDHDDEKNTQIVKFDHILTLNPKKSYTPI